MPRRIDKRDLEIGKLIKTQRLIKGMSQTDLATKLDLTFQQIQKYEKGTNRISAGRLFSIAELLGVELSYFSENSAGTVGATSKTNEAADLLRTPGAIQLVRAYNKIKARGMRTSVVDLVERIADVK